MQADSRLFKDGRFIIQLILTKKDNVGLLAAS